MKNSKPIKRNEALVSFSREHHFGLLLGWKIRQGLEKGISPERISNYVLYFYDNDLYKHFREEETLLFPLLTPEDELRKIAESQHRSICQIVASVKADKKQPVLLLQLANELEDHIRFEERELFNHIQQQVSINEFGKASSRQSNDSRVIEENWNDVFWQGNNSNNFINQ